MSKLPEGRQPLSWQDMPFTDRPKAHPSTERLEIEKLQARVAELEARVAAADKLIEDLLQHEGAERFSHSTYELEAAYQATKERD